MLHQYERVPKDYVLDEAPSSPATEPSVRLRSVDASLTESMIFTFEALGPSLFRTTFASDKHPLPPYPSAWRPAPFFPPGDAAPKVTTDSVCQTREMLLPGGLRALVEWSHSPVISLFLEGVQMPVHRDLPFRSYALDAQGVAHYSSYRKDTLHVGLGEKAAPMDLSGRGFLISASDTFGYDAYRTDPLYKHIPLLINAAPEGCVGIFSTSHARGTWNIGSEIDGLWGHFKVYRQAYGGLEEYLIVGRTLAEVVRRYAELVGFPLLVPRYMMGYVAGGMKYSMQDDPRAADAILGFLRKCEAHDIPVSAFQMSSGYTVAETEPKTRNVFTWNRHRFPDPRAFTAECHGHHGVRLLANVKPYVLASHPEYAALAEAGAFFRDPVTNSVAVARLWSAGGGESGEGSHIDFTSRAGYDWWVAGVRALKKVGIDAIWNDNNEYNIPSDDWTCALETVPAPESCREDVEGRDNPTTTMTAKTAPTELAATARRDVGLWGRVMHTELMARASASACAATEPDRRPMVLTRSATPGTMRYAASSWSGDNVTSWEGMRGGNALALNAGMSLLQVSSGRGQYGCAAMRPVEGRRADRRGLRQSYGHDIGGFEGPQPTPEHLVRWVQLGVHSPRFAINCFKTSAADNLVGDVIEPWMYPSATPLIRSAIKRRYELIPYIYSLALKSHLTAEPPQRWTGWGFESDPVVWTDRVIRNGDTQYWLGDALLVAGVYEAGVDTARVYLPRRTAHGDKPDLGYLNTNAPFQHLAAGRWHDISSTWHTSIPLLARVGSAIPVGRPWPTTVRRTADPEFPGDKPDDWRGVEIFPPPVYLEPDDRERSAVCAGNEPDKYNGEDESHGWFESTWLEDDGESNAALAPATLWTFTIRYRIGPPCLDDYHGQGGSIVAEVIAVCPTSQPDAPSSGWRPPWLATAGKVDLILPVGEERPVHGARLVGLDAKGRRVWQLQVVVR